MSSCSWSAAPLPIRTGREPRQPSKWSRVSSVRSEDPSTRYMIFSGPDAVAGVLGHPVAQPGAEPGRPPPGSPGRQGVHGQRPVPDPGEAVVPVPLAAGLLGQPERSGGDRRAGRLVGQQLEGHRRPGHHLPPAAGVGRAAQPAASRTPRCRPPAGRSSSGGSARGWPPIDSSTTPRPLSPSRIVKVARSPSPARSTVARVLGRLVAARGVQRQLHAVVRRGTRRRPRRSRRCAWRGRSRTAAGSRATNRMVPRATRSCRTSRCRSVGAPSMTGMKSSTSPTPSGGHEPGDQHRGIGEVQLPGHVAVGGRAIGSSRPARRRAATRTRSASRTAGSRTSPRCRRWSPAPPSAGHR